MAGNMFFLLAALIAAAAVVSPQPSSGASPLDQDALHTSEPIHSRESSHSFGLNGIGELSAPFGIEYHGLARIFMNENRPIDTFILDGNTLLANNRSGYCYIDQYMGYLACEKVPEGATQIFKDFSLARNGSLVYNGTANWWACPARQPAVYNVYCRKTSPGCKFIQLQSGATPKTKQSYLKHTVEDILPDNTNNLDTRMEKSCFFHMRVPQVDPVFDDLNEKLRKTFPYTLLGKRLGTGPNGFHYCYINAATFQLVCADKASEELMENFHSIDFSINNKGYLTHNGIQDWVFCKTSIGWNGPYSEKKITDSKCEASTVQIMVTTIAGYDCRPQMARPSVLARAWGGKSLTQDLYSLCASHTEKFVSISLEKVPFHLEKESRNEFSLIEGRLTWPFRHGSLASCFLDVPDSKLKCNLEWGKERMPGPDVFSIDPTKHYLWHENKDTWYQCPADASLYAEDPIPGFCSQIHLRAISISCQGPKNGGASSSSKLDLRSLQNTKDTTKSLKVSCPTNLANTVFKSPTLLVSISSESKSQALGAGKNISIAPTRRIIFNFFIPSIKPYENKECALLLLLPEIDYLSIDYQEGQVPGLQFYEVGGVVDEHTSFDTLPISLLLVSRTFPNEIRPGKNNFIATLPCVSGVKSIMIASEGGLSLCFRQEGVPNESGLHLVPCV